MRSFLSGMSEIRLEDMEMRRTFRKAKHILLIVVISASVVGCATSAQRQALAIRGNTTSAVQNYKACVLALYNLPEMAALRHDLPFNVNNATLEQLSNPDYASDTEIKVIFALYPKLQNCRKRFVAQIALTTPTIASIFLEEYTKSDEDLISLTQKRLTWGDFLRRGKEREAEASVMISTEARRIQGGLEQENEAELARRQAALNALTRYVQTQQLINTMNRPRMTNCMSIGYTMNCMTQ